MAKKILIVDDEPNIRVGLEMRLKKEGYDVNLSESGQEALVAYRRSLEDKPYDLVLLDIIMPGVSGLEVLETIRADEASRGIKEKYRLPIIMVTALRDSWKADAEQEGCQAFITKPFKAEDLLTIIRQHIRKD